MDNQENCRAIYYDGEWHKIIDCISCPHYDPEHDEDFPEKACMFVYHLHNIGERLGLTTCPLPLWNRVRDYTANEVPEPSETDFNEYVRDFFVLIKVKLSDNYFFKTGYFSETRKLWKDSNGNAIPVESIISWRYLSA